MTEMQAPKPAKATPAASSNDAGNDPRESYVWVGYRESGEWDIFSGREAALIYAVEGAKCRVEKRLLGKLDKGK